VKGQQFRGLIQNAHLGKIPSFCKISDLKITHLEINFHQHFCVKLTILIQVWHSKIKTILSLYKIVGIKKEKISKTYIKNGSELCE
jgi:hypothetical protein